MFSIYYHTPQGPVEPKKNERRHAAGPRALRLRDPLRNSLLSRKECRKQRPPRSSVRCRRGGGANKKNTVGLEEQAGVCVCWWGISLMSFPCGSSSRQSSMGPRTRQPPWARSPAIRSFDRPVAHCSVEHSALSRRG